MSNTRNRPSLSVALAALLLALLTLVASGQQPVTVTNVAVDPCADPSLVQNTSLFTLSAAARDELVTASGVQRVYVCSVYFQASGAGDLSLYFGTTMGTPVTTTACATGQTVINRTTVTALVEPMEFHSGGGSATAARSMTGQAFCVERHAAVIITGNYRWVRQ